MEFKSLNPEFDALRSNKEDMIKAIFEARTGIPYIDAIVRQLHKTGWTNFRSRALFVSFCSNSCMLPWQEIAPKLASLFTDYEPGIHYPQFQMQSATTAINTIRIYNPVLNSKKHDKNGDFIKKYIPELKNVPTEYIHEPHLWNGFNSISYPEPIIDIKEANREAREILWGTKKSISKETKQQIYKKHGSRVFKGKKSKQEQLSLFEKSKEKNKL